MRVQGTPSFANARNESRFRPGTATVDRLRRLAGGLLLCGIALVSATANAQTTLSASPTSVLVGGTVTATWSGIPAPSASNWLGLYTPGAPSNNFNLYSYRYTNGAASGSVPFTLPAAATPGTYELRLFSSSYTLLATSNSFTVVAPPSVSGTVTLNGAGLSGVAFTATNGVTCTTSSGSGQYSCNVPQGWSGSVTPSRGGVSFTPASRDYSNVTASQSAQNYAGVSTTTLSVSPTSVIVNGTVTATWSGTPGPADGNWLGLYKPGDPSSNFYLYGWVSVSGQASGSVLFTLPAAATPGTYELRLFSTGTYTVLAISNSFTVSARVSVSGTVTAAGSPLSGVAFAASNGGTCTSSNASGQYSCTVPQGWTGSVTPTLSGYSFTPAARSYSALQLNQTAQDFAATAVSALAIYYIVPDHLNTTRLVQDQAGNTVWRWDQGEPFGNDMPNSNPSGAGAFEFNLRFPGQYFDKETNLHYNYYRDYDPSLGIYKQSDLIGLRGGPNTYAYGNSDPITHMDPYGLLNMTFSSGGSGFAFTMGASAASGVAFDFTNGNFCFYSVICARVGAGLHASLQFLQIGVGSGMLCSGQFKVDGIFASGGPASGSIRVSNTGGLSVSSPRLGGGPGFGFAGGLEGCHVTLQCGNDSPCCSNPASCQKCVPGKDDSPNISDIVAP